MLTSHQSSDDESVIDKDEDDARLMAALLADLDAEDWEDLSAYS